MSPTPIPDPLRAAKEEAAVPAVVPADASTLHEREGSVLDRYRLLQRIGEGGFGVVWMAEQLEPVRRRVAVKVIKLGMDTRQVIARFEAERQALALMDHPNIAKVLDGGTTPEGRPYFVMELVRGIPITQFCDEAQLGIEQRLELFIDVCHAVQHAHQKGVIHRDVKPSNVLVTLHDDKPVPKVIDFGIAKATSAELTQKTLFTEFRQMIGTPEYMAPEQLGIAGIDVDTRADVYSLGVLLYELLTGCKPIDLEVALTRGYDEVLRTIREEEPVRPSTRATEDPAGTTLGPTTLAGVDPRELGARLRGDLDWIVLKALEKNRTRRYETAHGLALDIGRHLRDEPVLASPPSLTYQLSKFVRRHRAAVLTATLLTVALALGTAGTTAGLIWALDERDRAEQEATRSRLAAEAEARAKQAAEEAEREAREQAALVTENARVAAVTLNEVVDRAIRSKMEHVLESTRLEWEAQGEEYAISADYQIHGVFEATPEAVGRLAEEALRIVSDLEEAREEALEGQKRAEEEAARTRAMSAFLQRQLSELASREEAAGDVDALVAEAEALFGEGHMVIASVLRLRADALFDSGEFGQAGDALSRAVTILERVQGGDHPLTLSVLGELAVSCALGGNDEEAWRSAQRVLEDLPTAYPDQELAAILSEQLVSIFLVAYSAELNEPGSDYLHQLSDLWSRSVGIASEAFGDDHDFVARERGYLAAWLQTHGRTEEALAAMRPSAAYYLGESSEQADPSSVELLCFLAESAGDVESARDWRTRLAAVQEP